MWVGWLYGDGGQVELAAGQVDHRGEAAHVAQAAGSGFDVSDDAVQSLEDRVGAPVVDILTYVEVVPGFLRTLGFVSCVRFQFASCMVSPSRDMSRQRRVDQSLSVTYRILAVMSINALLPSGKAPTTRVRRRISRFNRPNHVGGADTPTMLDGIVVRQVRGGFVNALAQALGGFPEFPLLHLGGDLFGLGRRRFA